MVRAITTAEAEYVGRVRIYRVTNRRGWYLRWSHRGKTCRRSLLKAHGDSPERIPGKVLLEAEKLDETLKAGTAPVGLKTLESDYLNFSRGHGQAGPKQLRAIERDIDAALAFLKVDRVEDVERRDVERWLDGLQAKHLAPRTVNRYLGTFKGFLNWADEEARIPRNPLKGLKPREEGEPTRKRQAFTEAEVVRIFDAAEAGPSWQPIAVRLAYGAALRLREVRELTWGRVHLDTGLLEFWEGDQKNKKHQHVPIVPQLAAVLTEARAAAEAAGPVGEDTLVCPGIPNDPSPQHHMLIRRAGIQYRVGKAKKLADFHALRGTCLTHMAKQKVPLARVQKFARHSKPETTMGYIQEETEDIRDSAAGALVDLAQHGTDSTDRAVGVEG